MDNPELVTQPEVIEPTAQPEVETPVEPTPDLPKLKVKYNKEEKELSYEEAKDYAEKGMNYDKLKEQKSELENQKSDLEKQLAELKGSKWNRYGEEVEKTGMSRDQFAEMQIDNARAKKEGITREQAKALRVAEEKETFATAKLTEAETKLSEISKREQQDKYVQEQVSELISAYPDADLKNLPQDVKEMFDIGMPLKKAYDAHTEKTKLEQEIAKLKEQINVKTANDENAAASTGLPGTSGEPDKPLTREMIAQMSEKEQARRAGEIWELLTGQKN